MELTIVLVIIALLAALAVPRYARSLDRYNVDTAARRVVADLTYARRQALLTTQAKTVSFDVANATYTIDGVADFKGGSGPYIVDLQADPQNCAIVSAVFDAVLDPDDDTSSVTFNGYGIADSGGAVVVGAGGYARSIVLDPDSGEAAIQ